MILINNLRYNESSGLLALKIIKILEFKLKNI